MDDRLWHRLGVWLGMDDPTNEELREAEAAEERELERSTARVVAGVALRAALSGVAFGFLTWALLGDPPGDAVVGGAFFGVVMGAFYVWDTLSTRRKAARRVRERSSGAGP